MRFSLACDYLLLKAVQQCDAHRAHHGEFQTRFKQMCDIFVSGARFEALNSVYPMT